MTTSTKATTDGAAPEPTASVLKNDVEDDMTMNASASERETTASSEIIGKATTTAAPPGFTDEAATKEQVAAAATESAKQQGPPHPVLATKSSQIAAGDIYSLVDLPEPVPPQQPQPNLPGAYAVSGAARGAVQNFLQRRANTTTASNSNTNMRLDNHHHTAQDNDNDNDESKSNSGLVEATPLSEDQVGPIAIAAAQDPLSSHASSTGSNSHRNSAACRFYSAIGLALIVLLAAAALVGYIVGQSKSEAPAIVIVSPQAGDQTTTGQSNDDASIGNNSTGATADHTVLDTTPSNVLSILLDPHLFTSTIERLEEPSSPQYQAYQWLKDDPNLTSFTTARVIQRFAAATLYYATQGDQWDSNDGPVTVSFGLPGMDGFKVNVTASKWLDYNSHECSWLSFPVFEGVEREGEGQWLCPDYDPNVPTSTGSFINLNLFNNNLNGTLPPELGLLTTLEQVHLYRNPQLQGEIPSEVGLLTNLHYWSCRACKLSGRVPSEIGLLTKLTYLNTFRNLHTDALPAPVWRLPRLQLLRIGQNEISGRIPDAIGSQLPHIQLIRLSRNQMSGSIPKSIGDCSLLTELDLAANSFTGWIPSELGRLPLQELELGDNLLSGRVPSELAQLTGLVSLNLKNNADLTGSLEEFLPVATDINATEMALMSLSIQGTGITGTIPEEICAIEALTFDCSPSCCGCSCPCVEQP
ncbi:Leucine Rich Repeat [Seminavis robusta]|uniref:Leucine Rich Repeat n=1 Tax=Seminavis robusta TaxID=568900 RepID=A0A9N8E0J6_9STRA|nr:Leucine Rich Repeat [Seminavis robusta]|eukprot:Sro389_g132710.1 Leucine Rich Repeat (698) ;mRNA; f:64200-66293